MAQVGADRCGELEALEPVGEGDVIEPPQRLVVGGGQRHLEVQQPGEVGFLQGEQVDQAQPSRTRGGRATMVRDVPADR